MRTLLKVYQIIYTFVKALIALLFIFVREQTASAEEIVVPPAAGIQVFEEEYLSLEISRNFPMSFSQNRFEPGEAHPVIGYRHRFKQDWMMGIGGQFRIFERRPTDENKGNTGSLALWTIYHETNYVLRLDHPTYLLVGPRMTYFLPCQAAVIPLQRDPDYQSEFGIGLSLSVLRIISESYSVTARVERWRGTRTMTFQGLEVAFGLNYAL